MFLKAEFDLAWEQTAGKGTALDFLAAKHASSLSVLAPTDHARHWLVNRLLPPRPEAVVGKLSVAVDKEFSELLKRYDAQVEAQATLSEFRKAA